MWISVFLGLRGYRLLVIGRELHGDLVDRVELTFQTIALVRSVAIWVGGIPDVDQLDVFQRLVLLD